MGEDDVSGEAGAECARGAPRDEGAIGLHGGKTVGGGPDIDKADPCWPVGSPPIVGVAPHGNAAIDFERRIGAVAGKDLGVSGARGRVATAANNVSPGGDAAVGFERRIGTGVGSNAGIAAASGSTHHSAPGGDTAVGLEGGEPILYRVYFGVTAASGRAGAADGGAPPGGDTAVGLEGGERILCRVDLGVTAASGLVNAAEFTVTPSFDAAIIFQCGIGVIAGGDLGVAGAGGLATAAIIISAPGVDAAVGSEAGKGRHVGVFRARADGVDGTRALALVGQQQALHPEVEVLGDAAGGAGGVDGEREGARFGRVAINPAGGGIKLHANGQRAAGDGEVEAVPLNAQEQLRLLCLVDTEADRRAGGLREVRRRQRGRLHGEEAAGGSAAAAGC